ncbi:BgTH12-03855 [Blumeria graminis f. sp. triticale]|uniref:UV excision repair protein RAD23 n=3 Tax=Blumeria graminis TaxID=34373 RepID=A0A381L4Q5_BLUGR|nr:hypothetical protein BGT96224_2181 [Blumeria graminis f. sp. tritici 96224]CAD6499747.1 BgTH12-03855 [Blumeria graminis f. sp. triticale]
MKLSFRDLKQNKFIIEAEPSDLISTLKAKIAEEKGWDASTQKLIYSGKILQDANTVESYNIEERGFIVCMTAKPKAIPPIPASTAKAPSTPIPNNTLSTPAAPSQPTASGNENIQAATSSPTANTQNADSNSSVGPATSGLSMGVERDAQIAGLESMGFERSQIDAAMRAAFFNSERAVEYLLNGIPDSVSSTSNPPAANPAAPAAVPSVEAEDAPRNLFDAAAALGYGAGPRSGASRGASNPLSNAGTGTSANPGGLGNLDFLRNNPQFQQLRQVVQQQPQMLEPLLQQVGAGNPQLAALIGDHSQQFLQLLSEDAEGDTPLPPGAQSISVTEDERAAIERLCLLGFPRDMAIQAYFAFDKNEELAANFLFDQPDDEEQ